MLYFQVAENLIPDYGDSASSVTAAHSWFITEGSCDLVLGDIDTIGLITIVSRKYFCISGSSLEINLNFLASLY